MSASNIIITGATSGIGRITAEDLARQGHHVVLIGRDPARGVQAVAQIKAATGNSQVEFVAADLSSITAIAQLGKDLAARFPRLDVLINNAGAIFMRRQESVDGLEMTFALNHMAYLVLTQHLLPSLQAAPAARIVNVASMAHRRERLDFDDLQTSRNYSGWKAYCRSKAANILFTRELAKRLSGTNVIANCLHPGFVASRFGDDNRGVAAFILRIGKAIFAISPQKAARRLEYLALDPAVGKTNGAYFSNNRITEPSPGSTDPAAALKLWEISEALAAKAYPSNGANSAKTA